MTTATQLEKRKYPIGPFAPRQDITKSQLAEMIDTIASAPTAYEKIAQGLSENDLKKTYRDGSWNVQQLFNHVADMQLLHFYRMKRALTETDYKDVALVDINGWTATPDGLSSPIADSLEMFRGIVKRHVHLMRSLNDRQLDISQFHSVRGYSLDQKNAIAMSAWHVKHHLEHLKIALGLRAVD